MNFDIIDEKSRIKEIKKKRERLLIAVSIFFLLLSIVLIAVYFLFFNKKETPLVSKTVEEVEKPKLQIVDENSNERPLAVMIDNNIGSAKHAGLQESYINYEIIVEGNITRIMAIYKDRNVELIGPVRSSRHYFLDYALEHDAVYAHFGWSPYAEKDISALGVNNINGMIDASPFNRDSTQVSPHNVFTSTKKLRDYFEVKNYNSETRSWKLLDYSVDEINLNNDENEVNDNTEYEPASSVIINYSNNQNRSYLYNNEEKYYLRSMNSTPHIDRVTDEQLHFKNIIIMKVNNKTIDREGRQDLDTTGTGEGYYITNGYAKHINWTKENRNSKTIYKYDDGNIIKVNDGNTFIQIVPISSNIIIE